MRFVARSSSRSTDKLSRATRQPNLYQGTKRLRNLKITLVQLRRTRLRNGATSRNL